MTASVKFESVSPILGVEDLPRALDFYERTLGFKVAWSWGTPPELAAVCRDAVEITLRSGRADAPPSGASQIYLQVSGIDDYYAAVVGAGAQVVVPIGDRPYGMRDFRVADPSGNQINVGQAIVGVDDE